MSSDFIGNDARLIPKSPNIGDIPEIAVCSSIVVIQVYTKNHSKT